MVHSTRAWEHVDLSYVKTSFGSSTIRSQAQKQDAQFSGLARLLNLSGTRIDILYAYGQALTGVQQTARSSDESATASDAAHSCYSPQEVASIVEDITKTYEAELRHRPQHDRWDIFNDDPVVPGERATGRLLFKQQVASAIQRNAPVEFVLPAFPCKTSNLDKVSGLLPDKGEELALRTIFGFLDKVESIYAPGAIFHIVSDGHVFSDLIGVGDSTVYDYSIALRQMAASLACALRTERRSKVQFHRLDELLRPHPFLLVCLGLEADETDAALAQIVASLPTPGPTPPSTPLVEAQLERITLCPTSTVAGPPPPLPVLSPDIQPTVETQRAILVGVFGCRRLDGIDALIKEDGATLALFRGFSRFLLEDIGTHPRMLEHGASSMKQRKRICERLAKLMIQRNDAYSRLVEVRFPGAVRLSIHPHDNSGPKFAVCLIHARYRAGKDNDLVSDTTILHIPTPWHNVVLQLPPHPSDSNGGEKVTRSAEETLRVEGNYVLLKRRDVAAYRPDESSEIVFEPWRPGSQEPLGHFFFRSKV